MPKNVQWNPVSMKNRVNKLIKETELSISINSFSSSHIKWIAEKTEHIVYDIEII